MGYLHVYTGNGKGKTTCAVGLTVRAAGNDLRVAFVQFDKGFDGLNEHYNERKVLRVIPNVDVFPFGLERMMPDGKFRFENKGEDILSACEARDKARSLITGGEYGMVVLDEIITCVGTRLLRQEDVMDIVAEFRRQDDVELVMTGRGAWPELIEAADLVTEMTLVKHYWYEHKTEARPGIDF